MKIFCLIPAYNEKGNLEELISGLCRILPKICSDFQIFFVLQGNDSSLKLVKKLKLKNKKIGWLHFPHALGIGRAYKVGFNNIKSGFTHVLTLDADLNHDPRVIPEFLKTMKKTRTDLVIGSRFTTGGGFHDSRWWKRLLSLLINRLVTMLVNIKVHDISSGYRLFRREVIDKINNKLQESGYPSYMETVIITAGLGFKIAEVPITYQARVWGTSKMGKVRTFKDYLKFLTRIIFTF